MQITMTSTRRGSRDGFTLREYREGETYSAPGDISDELARRFIRSEWAYQSGEPTPYADFVAIRDTALTAAEGNPGLTAFLNELSASAVRISKERIVQNPATLLATGEL